MIRAKFGKGDLARQRDAAHAPHMQGLRRQPESFADVFRSNGVDKRAISVSMASHNRSINAALNDGKGETLLALNSIAAFTIDMGELIKRIRQRMEELSLTPAEAARLCGWSAQRFGNYISPPGSKNHRALGTEELVKIAKALKTSTDWLLGLSEEIPIETGTVFQAILELDGMSPARAEALSQVVQAALRVLIAFRGDGDAHTRARLAAQAAWQLTHPSKPS